AAISARHWHWPLCWPCTDRGKSCAAPGRASHSNIWNRPHSGKSRLQQRRSNPAPPRCALGRSQIALTFPEIVPGRTVERAGGLGTFVFGAAFAHRERLRRVLRYKDRGGNCRGNKQKFTDGHWVF